MARIKDFAVTELGTSTAGSLVCNMPQHAAGDVLIYFASKDGNPVINATTGWTNIQDGATAGSAYRSMFKLAASSSETLTVDTGTAENWCVVVLSIEGADGSSLANLIANSGAATAESAADDTAIPFDGPSTSTNTDTNCLILHAWFTDSGLSPTAYAPLVNIYAGDSGANSTGVAYTFQTSAGAVAAASWFGRGNDDGRGIVMAIKDNSGGTLIPPYSDPSISSGQVLRPFVGLSTMQSDSWPTSLSLPAIGDDFDYAYTYVNATTTYTDVKTAINDATTADVTFPATQTADAVYFGGTDKFQSVIINVSTAGVGGVLAWEYYNGSSWVSTGVTGSNLTATGWTLITLNTTAVAAMSQTTVNSVNCYWLRSRITTTYTTAIVASQARKDGRTATYVAAAASADNGTNPYTDGASNAGSTTTTTLAGCQWTFGSALDLDTGIIYGTYRFTLHRDGAIDMSFPFPIARPGGLQVTFADTNNFYKSYIVTARGANDMDPNDRNVFAIDWNGNATAWAERNSVNKSAVTYSLWTSLGQSGAVAVVWSMLSLVTRIGLAGGSSTYPLDFDDVQYVANQCIGMFPFIKRSGSAAAIYVPLQFGGNNNIRLVVDKMTLQFPTIYDGSNYFNWNVAANVAGVKFYPKSGDIIKFTNCLFTSPSAYRWEFDSSMASSGFTLDFTGTTVVGATVTLQSAADLDSMTFISCPTFTQNGATLTNCNFTDTKVDCSSPANAALISDCSFTSGGSGHAIEISGTAADFTLDGVTFSGYSGTSTNAPIYVNIASGTMTIAITGGGTTPTIRTAGATVNVQNAVTLSVKVQDKNNNPIENAQVAIFKTSDDTQLMNEDTLANGIASETFNYTGDTPIYVRVRKSSGTPKYIPVSTTGTITATGYSLTVTLFQDEIA